MAKKPAQGEAKRRGRPAVDDPLEILLNVRVNRAFAAAAEAYREKHGINKVSTAVRHAAERIFRREGFFGDDAGKVEQ